MQYRLWRFVTIVIRLLPQGAAEALGSAIGTATFFLWLGGRSRMLRNYAHVLPTATPAQRRRTARRSLANYCRYLAQFARLPAEDPQALAAGFAPDAFAPLDGALREGRGAIAVCMHFGNWDRGASAVAARGYRATVAAETFADPRLDALVAGEREAFGLRLSKIDRPAPSLLRALRRNEIVALLIDRPLETGGVPATFFGGPVRVPEGPARLALATGAPVIAAAFPLTSGHSGANVLASRIARPEPSGDATRDVAALTQAILDAHEVFIQRYPSQWYMFRDFWPEDRADRRQ